MSDCKHPTANELKYSGPGPRTDMATGIDDLPVVQMQLDRVPTADAQAPVATYLDWNKADTEIVTYSVGNNIYKGIFAETRDSAKSHCESTRGRILEANYVPGRAFFRVLKVKKVTK